jgi:dimethylglycine dehydrogenase
LAMGYIEREHAAAETFEIEIIGERRPARQLFAPAYDPQGLRMRS